MKELYENRGQSPISPSGSGDSGNRALTPISAKDIYAALGVKRRINAAGTLTRLGGALMDDEVLAAMAADETAFKAIADKVRDALKTA